MPSKWEKMFLTYCSLVCKISKKTTPLAKTPNMFEVLLLLSILGKL